MPGAYPESDAMYLLANINWTSLKRSCTQLSELLSLVTKEKKCYNFETAMMASVPLQPHLQAHQCLLRQPQWPQVRPFSTTSSSTIRCQWTKNFFLVRWCCCKNKVEHSSLERFSNIVYYMRVRYNYNAMFNMIQHCSLKLGDPEKSFQRWTL